MPGRYGIPSVIDSTRVRDDEYQRHEDILHWVQQHEVEHWIAIDDLPMYQLNDDEGEHYVETCPRSGLTDSNVEQAIRLLNV